MKITREMFVQATGLEPQDDDLERCNCEHAGEVGHTACGWNMTSNRPQFMCGFYERSSYVTPTNEVR